MTQGDLAKLLGVSRSAVNAWENDRMYPQGSIGALEEILGISLGDDNGDEPAAPSRSAEEALERAQREIDALRQMLREGKKVREPRDARHAV